MFCAIVEFFEMRAALHISMIRYAAIGPVMDAMRNGHFVGAIIWRY
jgi:hypothetical protein